MFIQWNPSKHSIDLPLIDDQHKELFIITNQLHELLDLEQYQDKAVELIRRLYNYSSYHFISEEGLFKEYRYPKARSHKKSHDDFRRYIKDSLSEMRSRPNFSLAELLDYLVKWIIEHVQGEDREYSEYFEKNDIMPDLNFSMASRSTDDVLSLWEEKKLRMELKEIDDQHKQLVMILQQTNDLQYTGAQRKKIYIPIIIKKLFYYSQFHFSYEEEHMSKNGYPDIGEHKILHKNFINDILDFAKKFAAGRADLTDEIVLFLKDWTINHILADDKNYKNYLEQIVE